MKQFMQFVEHHWQLWGALVVIIVWLIFEELTTKIGALRRLNVTDAVFMVNHDNALVIDLRTEQAFNSGHILHALNFPAKDFTSHSSKILIHKERPLILIDSNDAEAQAIGKKLILQGCSKVYLLARGIDAWKSSGMPLTTNKN